MPFLGLFKPPDIAKLKAANDIKGLWISGCNQAVGCDSKNHTTRQCVKTEGRYREAAGYMPKPQGTVTASHG